MANIPLKSIKFPDLDDTYTVPSNAGELPYNKSATYPDDTVGKALQDKPDADGTIANAEQLTSNIYEEDSVPYNFRTSGGSIDIGDRETDMLVGGTVAWNQHVSTLPTVESSFTDGVKVSAVDTTNGKVTVVVDTDGATDTRQFVLPLGFGSLNANHKYLQKGCPSGGSLSSYFIGISSSGSYGQDIGNGGILANYGSGFNYRIQITQGCPAGTYVFTPQFFDLTQMFGTTIADYIYSLEQANAGAGVAWFKKLFPKPYYAYNAGELMSVNASSHDMVGFNQWDEEWEEGVYSDVTGAKSYATNRIRSKNKIKVVPNTTYYIKCSSTMTVYGYDANENYLRVLLYAQNQTLSVPNDISYITFNMGVNSGAVYQNDICINLSWDGERDGEYEAYVKHSYPLDSSLTLRGIPKLDSNNNLYYDGDTYESDGTVTRKYGVVMFDGSTDENWAWSTDGTKNRVYCYGDFIPNLQPSSWNLVSDKLIAQVGSMVSYPDEWKMQINATPVLLVGVPQTITSADAWRAYLASNPITIVYELATPTTETADAFTNPQIVNDFGTEEYVDYAVSQGDRDVSIPVGHETQYMANLKAKLEMSPNSPEGAGDYIVRQTNGENEYVTLASNATIQDIIARLEALENAES